MMIEIQESYEKLRGLDVEASNRAGYETARSSSSNYKEATP